MLFTLIQPTATLAPIRGLPSGSGVRKEATGSASRGSQKAQMAPNTALCSSARRASDPTAIARSLRQTPGSRGSGAAMSLTADRYTAVGSRSSLAAPAL